MGVAMALDGSLDLQSKVVIGLTNVLTLWKQVEASALRQTRTRCRQGFGLACAVYLRHLGDFDWSTWALRLGPS